MLDRPTRKRLFNLCDPAEPLQPGDPRYVDLDAMGARGGFRMEEIARRIELSDRPVCELLWATPGAGVTTELLRLGALLREEAKLLTVYIDAATTLDLWSSIDATDLLLAIVERTEHAVAEAGGRPPSKDLSRRFSRWLSATEIELLPGPSIALRSAPALRERVRSDVHANWSKFVAEVREELTLLEHAARKLGRDGIAVLFDGLETLRGTSTNWLEVLHSAERLFVRGSPLMTLPIHTVYTVPAGLLLRLGVPVHVLPMISVVDLLGYPRAEGMMAAEQIITGRFPEGSLEDLFGIAHRTERIENLLAASGGSPQMILRLLRDCIAESSLDAQSFSRILVTGADPLQRAILRSDAPWLARVHLSKELRVDGETDRGVAERALSNGAVLAYEDGGTWFDLHPAVLSVPVVAAEVVRMRRAV